MKCRRYVCQDLYGGKEEQPHEQASGGRDGCHRNIFLFGIWGCWLDNSAEAALTQHAVVMLGNAFAAERLRATRAACRDVALGVVAAFSLTSHWHPF